VPCGLAEEETRTGGGYCDPALNLMKPHRIPCPKPAARLRFAPEQRLCHRPRGGPPGRCAVSV